jgi:hypothetical protein
MSKIPHAVCHQESVKVYFGSSNATIGLPDGTLVPLL